MNLASRVTKLSHKKRVLLSIWLQSCSGVSQKDAQTNDQDAGYMSHVQSEAESNNLLQRQGETTVPMIQAYPHHLVAYVVLKKSHDIESGVKNSELQKSLRNRLPEYMMPSVLMFLDKLPRNSNGKIDYQALPSSDPVSVEGKPFLDPQWTPTEVELKNIWSQVLGVDQIGAHDNFFNLGGHSLLIARIISKIRSTFGVNIFMRALFQYPTLSMLGKFIDTLIWTKSESETNSHTLPSNREEFEI